ncbi:MAG: CatB-related O-acetyltransferase [Ardenticatenaceae bacterium]|nr:CatB-related O-acetyltransferase [Ardenticatenaceae bacterium]
MIVKKTIKKIIQPSLSWIGDALTRAQLAQQRERVIKKGLLTIGDYTYGAPSILDSGGDVGKVIIGRYCSIAKEVTILVGGNHHPDWVSMYPIRIMFDLPGKFEDGQPFTKGDVIIGSDVWIGQGSFILSGVRIGNGAVIAARSVCTRDVPDYAIVAGMPARIIRMRFSESQIDSLLNIAWWNWNHDKVKENVKLLCSSNVDEFIRKFSQE